MSDGKKLLSAIMGAQSITALRQLSDEFFVNDEITLYHFIQAHLRRFGVIPAQETAASELSMRIPMAIEPIDFYLVRVTDRLLYNLVHPAFGTLREALTSRDAGQIRDVIHSLGNISRTHSPNQNVFTIAEGMLSMVEAYDYAQNNPGVSGVPSGWDRFDENTGGYQGGDLITFVGRPGIGKTYVLLKQALAGWRAGYNVLVVTTEMPLVPFSRRLAAMDLGIDPDKIKKGMLSTYTQRRLRGYAASMAGIDRLRIYSADLSGSTSVISNLVQEFSPDALYIDGIYMLRSAKSGKNSPKSDRTNDVLDDIKQITIDSNIPVIAASQLNRAAGKSGKDASLETIGYTDAIGTHSSIVVAIKEGSSGHEKDRRTLGVMKGREGETGDFEINFKFAPTNMDELTDAEIAESQTAQGETSTANSWQG